jgi:hypothetical protein
MQFLRQSTQTDIVIGPVWSTSDGALKSDLAYDAAGINCDLYKGATKADVTLANSAGDGYFRPGSGEAQYLLTLSTTHTNTVGRLRLTLSATGYYMKPEDYFVFPANLYDAFVGSDYLQVDAVQVEGSDATNQIRDSVVDDATRIDASALNTLSGHDPGATIAKAGDLMGLANGAITTAKFAAGAIDAAAIANNAIDFATFAADCKTGAGLKANVESISANAVTAAAIATDAIDADALKADAVSEIQSGLATAAALATVAGVTGKLDTAMEADGEVYRFTAGALAEAPTGGGGGGASAEEIWTYEERGLTEAVDLVDAPNATALGAIADKLLGRALQGGTDGGRTVRQALRRLRNRTRVNAGTLTVYAENDSSSDWTAAVTTSSTADPVTEIDPS